MSSRKKKGQEWEDKIIGFDDLDPEYGTVFTSFLADYHQLLNVLLCVFVNAILSYDNHCKNVCGCTLINQKLNAF